MNRGSLRTRIALAYAGFMLLVVLAGGFALREYVADQLDESIEATLEARAAELGAVLGEAPRARGAGFTLLFSDDGYAEVVSATGKVVGTSGPGAESILTEAELDQARGGGLRIERSIPGVEGRARILAQALEGPRDRVLVVAASTEDRSEAVGVVTVAMLVGGPLAVLAASLAGFLLAGRSLRPVESMRRRAERISLERAGERLPTGAADDEIGRLGETLNAMLDRIEAGLARERQFTADASHELRTPLANLRAELELAGSRERSPEELRSALGSAVEEVDRLARLTDDLLVIARADAGRLPITRERHRVGEMLARLAERFAIAHPACSVALREGSDLTARVDPLRVEQAVGNCVENACRYGGGVVELTARLEDGDLIIHVDDRGPGLPEGFAQHAFERFSRPDKGRSGGGTGLGLAIVAAIAEAHAGGARLLEREGGGTRCELRFGRAR